MIKIIPKKLLTLEDLCSYYSTKPNSCHFSSQEKGQPLFVQTKGFFEVSETATLGLMPVQLKICHIGANENGSYIAKDVMEKALPSLSNRPILGNIIQLDDGSFDFHSHDIIIDEETNEIEYIERSIGVFPESCQAHLEYDKENDKTYTVANGYIYEDYGNKAATILKRKKCNKVSVELCINELSYNAKDKLLIIDDFYFNGVTCLGSKEDGTPIKEGMLGSQLTLQSFTKNNNSLVGLANQDKLIKTIEKLNNTISAFNAIKFKEDKNKPVAKLDELLKKYNVSIDSIPFKIEHLSDNELEIKFKELYSRNNAEHYCKKKRIINSKGNTEITFEISHNDIRSSLYYLLESYEVADNEYYWISEVYNDHFIYEGAISGKIYNQKYKVENDTVSFIGEREERFRELITASEKAQLEEMRTNYSIFQEKIKTLETKQLNDQKENLLTNEKYSLLFDTEPYKALCSEKESYSLEEIEIKLKCLFADSISTAKLYNSTFEETYKKTFVPLAFQHQEPESSSFLDGLKNRNNK